LWNSAALETAQKLDILEHADSFRYPPLYSWAYQHDCEADYIEGDTYKLQAFDCISQAGLIATYPWEAAYDYTNQETPDSGYRITQAWESVYGAPADPVRIALNAQLDSIVYLAWDEEALDPIDERMLAQEDGWYRTTSGTPRNYYRPDREQNEVVLYPRPSSVTWDDDLTYDDDGEIVIFTEDAIDTSDVGLSTDIIDTDGQCFMIYKAVPTSVESVSDEIDWCPPFVLAAVRAATLERAYGANTDGFVPSLRDYWKMRKDTAIKALLLYKYARLSDRDIRLGGGAERPQRMARPRMPDGYPRVWE
jgi:hypothetical protein